MTTPVDASAQQSPLIHVVDDDDAVRHGLSLLIGSVGLRAQPWADPMAFLAGFDRGGIGAVCWTCACPASAAWPCWSGWWPTAWTSR
jgi:two-component system response regulator FixJ